MERCHKCGGEVDDDDVTWINPLTGDATDGPDGKPYCNQGCVPAQPVDSDSWGETAEEAAENMVHELGKAQAIQTATEWREFMEAVAQPHRRDQWDAVLRELAQFTND